MVDSASTIPRRSRRATRRAPKAGCLGVHFLAGVAPPTIPVAEATLSFPALAQQDDAAALLAKMEALTHVPAITGRAAHQAEDPVRGMPP